MKAATIMGMGTIITAMTTGTITGIPTTLTATANRIRTT